MIADTRARYADIAARRHFVKEGTPISDTRQLMAELTAPPVPSEWELEARAADSATSLQQAASGGFIEVG